MKVGTIPLKNTQKDENLDNPPFYFDHSYSRKFKLAMCFRLKIASVQHLGGFLKMLKSCHFESHTSDNDLFTVN